MSFILDALRKSELERQRQSGPSIAEIPVARDDRRLPVALVAIGVLLVVNVAVLAYFLMRDEAPAPATTAAPPPAQQASNTAPVQHPFTESSSAGAPAAVEQIPGPVASAAPETADPTLLPDAPDQPPAGGVRYESAPPTVEALPPPAPAGLAELSVDLHIFATDPARRAVFVNGRRYTEGMALAEGPVVEEITRDGVVINHRGQRFLLPRN